MLSAHWFLSEHKEKLCTYKTFIEQNYIRSTGNFAYDLKFRFRRPWKKAQHSSTRCIRKIFCVHMHKLIEGRYFSNTGKMRTRIFQTNIHVFSQFTLRKELAQGDILTSYFTFNGDTQCNNELKLRAAYQSISSQILIKHFASTQKMKNKSCVCML